MLALALCLTSCGCSAGDGDIESTLGNTPANVSVQDPANLAPSSLPAYSGTPYITINNNEPAFTDEDQRRGPFEAYAPLDALGRCGTAFALVGTETMPTEERESISEVHPSGWHSSLYSWIDGESLYNRCHLLGFQLTGENANERNLITGTRYLNTQGMLPFEEGIARYIDKTGNHVLYRVKPVFEGENLVASGVHMEALSVEDGGAGVRFNVYCYNVQPGVTIDYATGDNWEGNAQGGADAGAGADASKAGGATGAGDSGNADAGASGSDSSGNASANNASADDNASAETAGGNASSSSQNAVYSSVDPQDATYVLNVNTHKFHRLACGSIGDMAEKHRLYTAATRDQITAAGFNPCKRCNP